MGLGELGHFLDPSQKMFISAQGNGRFENSHATSLSSSAIHRLFESSRFDLHGRQMSIAWAYVKCRPSTAAKKRDTRSETTQQAEEPAEKLELCHSEPRLVFERGEA